MCFKFRFLGEFRFIQLKRYIKKLVPWILGAGSNSDDGVGASTDQVEAANVAKECLLAAIKADPRAAHLWSNLANAYFLVGDHRNASKCLEKVLFSTVCAFCHVFVY